MDSSNIEALIYLLGKITALVTAITVLVTAIQAGKRGS